MKSPFTSPTTLLSLSLLVRVLLLLYGLYQDTHSPLKYTDIDYSVFTDASRFVSRGHSPYDRETYRYTPLLAWLLLPTTWQSGGVLGGLWFLFGKMVFATGDLVAGWLIIRVLRAQGMSVERACKFASIWLLNPMVATISTRGSSEGLLGVMVMGLLWAVMHRRVKTAGVLLGLAVHFKIYPIIYAPSIIWWLDEDNCPSSPSPPSSPRHSTKQQPPKPQQQQKTLLNHLTNFLTRPRLTLTLLSLFTFTLLNTTMYTLYGHPFLQNTYLHHLTRIDHRHNFSPYNTLLYLSNSPATAGTGHSPSTLNLESLSFIPQLLLSAIFIPLALAKKDLPSTMLAQTFAFVAFNKVCTSQYFLWYTIFLPFYLPHSAFLQNPYLGLTAAFMWVAAQTLWLSQAFRLEFHGQSTFVPSLWLSSLVFFIVNVAILGVVISDVGEAPSGERWNQTRTGRSDAQMREGQ